MWFKVLGLDIWNDAKNRHDTLLYSNSLHYICVLRLVWTQCSLSNNEKKMAQSFPILGAFSYTSIQLNWCWSSSVLIIIDYCIKKQKAGRHHLFALHFIWVPSSSIAAPAGRTSNRQRDFRQSKLIKWQREMTLVVLIDVPIQTTWWA